MSKESARDEKFKFFKFISPTISMWVQYVLQGMPKFISTHTLKDPFHESKPMNFGSMVYVYDWMMEEHQPISIDYQPIQDDDYIEDSITQHYMEFNEDHRDESRFCDHTFSQAEFDKFNKKYKATADMKRREKLFEEKDMIMVYLSRGRIPT